jgi:hypothetical protein
VKWRKGKREREREKIYDIKGWYGLWTFMREKFTKIPSCHDMSIYRRKRPKKKDQIFFYYILFYYLHPTITIVSTWIFCGQENHVISQNIVGFTIKINQ